MKRTLCEVTAAGAVLFVLAGLYAELDGLRDSDAKRTVEIARLETSLHQKAPEAVEASTAFSDEVRRQSAKLTKLHDDYNGLLGQIAKLESRVEEGTRSATRQATNAIVKSTALSKTVESAQKEIVEAKRNLAVQRETINRRLLEYSTLLSSLRTEARLDTDAMTATMLRPTVQLSGDETVGSGIIIASIPRRNGKGFDSYVLTAYHVVRNILADDPTIERRGITVTIYDEASKSDRLCDIIAKNAKMDVALCKLRGKERVEPVARLIAPNRISEIEVWHPIFAVGCPLGNDPIPTGGFVSSLASEVRGTSYWMVNAPTYYGNSGGGIYCGEDRELVAVFSKIYTHGSSRPVVIPHMGLCVPMTLIYPWLKTEGYDFLIPKTEGLATESETQPSESTAKPLVAPGH